MTKKEAERAERFIDRINKILLYRVYSLVSGSPIIKIGDCDIKLDVEFILCSFRWRALVGKFGYTVRCQKVESTGGSDLSFAVAESLRTNLRAGSGFDLCDDGELMARALCAELDNLLKDLTVIEEDYEKLPEDVREIVHDYFR